MPEDLSQLRYLRYPQVPGVCRLVPRVRYSGIFVRSVGKAPCRLPPRRDEEQKEEVRLNEKKWRVKTRHNCLY